MFPSKDRNWVEAADFVRDQRSNDDVTIAPKDFQENIPNCVDCLTIDTLAVPDRWFVMHKGWTNKFSSYLLERVLAQMKPVYANPVFVIFCSKDTVPLLDRENIHLKSLFYELKSCQQQTSAVRGTTKTLKIFDNIRSVVDLSRSDIELLCRDACQTSYLGDRLVLCRVLTKYFCYVDATDITLTPHLLLNGYWEVWITKLFAKVIKPGWNCIDIGANCGYYTLLMADLVGRSGRVISVEPNPNLSNLVAKSVRINGFDSRVQISDRAVTDRFGEEVQLCVPDGFLGDAKIYDRERSSAQDSTSKCFSITTTTVDDLVGEWSHVNFIKIDAEGAEWLIWQGMKQTIINNPQLIILMEFSNNRLDFYDPKVFLSEIVSSGFSLNIISGDSQLEPIDFDECLSHQDKFIDLILTRAC
jgi:FkbM family methyltransferase